jgi:hypothetical protein
MIMQYRDMLQSQGFVVELDKEIQFGDSSFNADIFASKEREKRLYEFKLVGNGQMPGSRQRESIRKFKEIAAAVDAKPFLVYVNPPVNKNIEIEGLEDGLNLYMLSEPSLPDVLEKLSPTAKIASVQLEKVNNVNISPHYVKVDGNATIYVTLPSIIDADANEGFPMQFKAVFVAKDNELSFMKVEEYSIDTSDWYND